MRMGVIIFKNIIDDRINNGLGQIIKKKNAQKQVMKEKHFFYREDFPGECNDQKQRQPGDQSRYSEDMFLFVPL